MAVPKIRALLLDLDDTLLINDMVDFSSGYYRALLGKLSSLCPPVRLMEALQFGVEAMLRNDGRGPTNAEVFYREFLPRTGCAPEDLVELVDEFYRVDFDALRVHTDVDPDARRLVRLARERGYQLAVATQPLFPHVAILARLRWADVPHEEFEYEFVASYDSMRACKPHRAYFRAILQELGRQPRECVMVGDNVDTDLAGAARLGLRTYWVQRGTDPRGDASDGGRPGSTRKAPPDAQGSLAGLIRLIETGEIDAI